MKLQVKRTTTEEIDVEFPCFVQHGSRTVKLIDETHTIDVLDSKHDNSLSISIHNEKHPAFELFITKGDRISEQAFEEKLQDVSERIGAAIKQSSPPKNA